MAKYCSRWQNISEFREMSINGSKGSHRGRVFLVVESDKGITLASVVGVNNSAIPSILTLQLEKRDIQTSLLQYTMVYA